MEAFQIAIAERVREQHQHHAIGQFFWVWAAFRYGRKRLIKKIENVGSVPDTFQFAAISEVFTF